MELKLEIDKDLQDKLSQFQKNNEIETLEKATISFIKFAHNELNKKIH